MLAPNEDAPPQDHPRVSTGNPQLDPILGGGFPAHSINILMGHPGTGKTVLAEQLLFHNATGDRPVLYLSTLSEPLPKVITHLQRFEFFQEWKLGGAVVYDDLGQSLLEEGTGALLSRVRQAIREAGPKVLVVDSFKAIHDMVESASEMRRLVAELAGVLSAYDVTTFLVGEYAEPHIPTFPEFAVADGIVQLARRGSDRRDERFLRVLKLRGSGYRQGAHAFRITAAGLEVYPRLVAPRAPEHGAPADGRVPTGAEGLDRLLGGGLFRGSSTLALGASGTGKTSLGLAFAAEGLRRGEGSLFLGLQENPTQLARTAGSVGEALPDLLRRGLHLRYASPVEVQIDSIVGELFETIQREGIERVVIDSLGDLALAASDQQRFHDYVYSLNQHFTTSGVTSLMTLEQPRPMAGWHPDQTRISSISDVLIELSLELDDPPRRTLRVIKARGTEHDLRAHEIRLDGRGFRVLGPLAA